MQALVDGLAPLSQLQELELDLCGSTCNGGGGAISILVDGLLARHSNTLQSLSLAYSGYGQTTDTTTVSASNRFLPALTRLVRNLEPSTAQLQLTLQDMPHLLQAAAASSTCSLGCTSNPLFDFLDALEERPPSRFCVGRVGLDANAVAMICRRVGSNMNGENSQLGMWDNGLLQGECLTQLLECIPELSSIKTLALQDTHPEFRQKWNATHEKQLIAAIERNSSLYHLDFHFDPYDETESATMDETEDETRHTNDSVTSHNQQGEETNSKGDCGTMAMRHKLDVIFRRNRCIDFVRSVIGVNAPTIPHSLWPVLLEAFGDEAHSATLTYLFLQANLSPW
eukprot:CAMPEP_0172461990 /NCGR_PEP_ID=MMETSP1065-20121228/42384_1 /TAXON_ID=265537 /ORGANISM="Amphiprora paludosa, Strain CCMP125" /LENGTH=339 /DNA_ID=CAMNT_0013217513 /DNA_START=147 /DNA_END=1163 /DNA_ORIENTATION=-